jgi:hypothetical protein
MVDKTAAFMSSAQARVQLLCGECEHRFNQDGENWVLDNCWRSPTHFPLHSALMAAPPLLEDCGFRSWEGFKVSGVDVGKLAYFGASIFWRAGVHDWRAGTGKGERIHLGPYQDALRPLLLGKNGMPDGIVMLVTLSAALDDLHNRVSVMPWLFDRTREYRTYKFVVTGVTFLLFVGMMTPKSIRRMCTVRRGFLYMSEERDADLLRTMAVMVNRSERRGKLAKT